MSDKRPNIILLVSEDVGRHHGCYGDPMKVTPNLDRFAEEGCRYTHAISTAPVCAPSRSSIISGVYPWSLGTHHMRSTLLNPPRLFTHELRDAGYYVNWHTKTDFNFEPPADFADETNDWVERLRTGTLPDKPFFLFRNFSVTHESTMWASPQGNDRGAAKAREDSLHLLPPERRTDPGKVSVPAYLPDKADVREDIARYYDALAIADLEIQAVLEALAQSPYADNTIVIYTSDHGRGLLREKRWCYEAGIHLPLIIRDGRGEVTKPNATDDEIVNWVDFAPTILALAEAPIPQQYQGRAFLGHVTTPPRAFAFAGRDRMDCAFDRVRAVRDDRYLYIRNFWPQLPYAQRLRYMEHQLTTQVARELNAQGKLEDAERQWFSPTKPPEELYDCEADPQNVHNLADDPAHADNLARLRQALNEHIEHVKDLGAVPETELIQRGMVKDRLEEYNARVGSLPEHLRIGPPQTLCTQEQAEAWIRSLDDA